MELITKLSNQRVYFDTNIIIYLIEGLPEYEHQLGEIGFLLERDKLQSFTSELSLCECLVKPFKSNATKAIDLFRSFLEDSDCFELLAIDKNILIQSAYISAKTGMKTPDAIHVATAIASHCDTFLTNDKSIRTPKKIEKVLLSNYIYK